MITSFPTNRKKNFEQDEAEVLEDIYKTSEGTQEWLLSQVFTKKPNFAYGEAQRILNSPETTDETLINTIVTSGRSASSYDYDEHFDWIQDYRDQIIYQNMVDNLDAENIH